MRGATTSARVPARGTQVQWDDARTHGWGTRRVVRRLLLAFTFAVVILVTAAYLSLPWYSRWGTSDVERHLPLAGDQIVSTPQTGYTLAITIRATADETWPWLVQMGQGKAGFYTHEWVETMLRADIENADRIIPEMQHLAVGDTVRLTPDPYLGQKGQFMTVAEIEPRSTLVFRQVMPNGERASWTLALRSRSDGTTRLLSRRRGGEPSLFDRVMGPGYVFMDRGVLHGIRERAEATAARLAAHVGGEPRSR